MKNKRIAINYILIFILLIILLVLNISIGSVKVSVEDLLDILFGRCLNETYRDIVITIRLPRALAAILTGGALSLSGYCLQTFFRNPIAGPYILGISSGAKLMVALTFIIGGGSIIGPFGQIFSAFAGALISLGFVLMCSKKVNSMALLLVCGVMIGYICTAITDFVVTFADDADIVNLHNWSKGSLSGMSFDGVFIMVLLILSTCFFIFMLSKPMTAYMMGEEYAKSLGVNILLFRALLVITSSILAATVTAFVGPVSFVGIAVPHLVRGMFKETKPFIVIPACFLMGAVFTELCDLLARVIFAPTELSISSVTAVFGAPIVIIILLRKKR